jgi:hypothetical protein
MIFLNKRRAKGATGESQIRCLIRISTSRATFRIELELGQRDAMALALTINDVTLTFFFNLAEAIISTMLYPCDKPKLSAKYLDVVYDERSSCLTPLSTPLFGLESDKLP